MKWGNLNLMSDTSKFIEHISFIQSQTNKALSKIPLKPELTSYFYDPISYVLKGKGKIETCFGSLSGAGVRRTTR